MISIGYLVSLDLRVPDIIKTLQDCFIEAVGFHLVNNYFPSFPSLVLVLLLNILKIQNTFKFQI